MSADEWLYAPRASPAYGPLGAVPGDVFADGAELFGGVGAGVHDESVAVIELY